jgi:hypothetical protein
MPAISLSALSNIDRGQRQIFSPAAPGIRGAFGPAKSAFPPSMAVAAPANQSPSSTLQAKSIFPATLKTVTHNNSPRQ